MNSATVVRFASALEITTDELLQPNSAQTPLRRRPSLCVLRRSERIERLPLHQQDTLLKTIDGFLKRRCQLTANTPRTQHEQGRTVFDFIRVMFDVIGSRHPLGARHRALREDAGDDDWVFPSVRNEGKTPRSGSILVTDYLKRAAYEAGVLKKGEKVQFGMHNLRHSLATYLIAVGRDVKTVQTILRHANPMTTLQLYAHGRSQDRSDAQGEMLTAFFAPPTKPPTDVVQ